MSYEIVYAKQFIKTKNYIIPIVLTGSNNCYMYYGGREIRERDWTVLSNNLFGLTAEQLKDTIQKEWIDKTTYDEFFKCNGKWVHSKELKNFIDTGIKKALTIEEIKESTGYSTKCALSIWKNHENHHELEEYIHDNETFEQWIEKAQKRYNNKKETEQVYFCIKWDTIKPLKAYNTQINGQVLVKYGTRYLTSKEHFTFDKDKERAIIFDNIEQAKEHCKGWNFKFVKYSKSKPPKEKNFAIQYNSQYYGKVFMRKHTRNSLYPTTSIEYVQQKFLTKEKAQEFIDNVIKGFRVSDVKVINIKEYMAQPQA